LKQLFLYICVLHIADCLFVMRLIGASLLALAVAEKMPIPQLLPAYISVLSEVQKGNTSDANFVFLQKFPLGVSLFFHTEVLVCPRAGFSAEDAKFLDSKIAAVGDVGFLQIADSWWTTKTANCVELGYGGASCSEECCSVPHGSHQQNYRLQERRAVIGNADGKQKSLYIYGTGGFDGNVAWHDACDKKCWSNWAGTDYNPLTNNCNTFTSTVLKLVFGLSEKKPHLGLSDMVTVKGLNGQCHHKVKEAGSSIKVIFKTTMGPTVFTVSEAAMDGRQTIVPAMDDSAFLTFDNDSVTKMMAAESGITVRETGKKNPKGATCGYMTAGPITGALTCKVFFSMINVHCECENFPRAPVFVV